MSKPFPEWCARKWTQRAGLTFAPSRTPRLSPPGLAREAPSV